MTSTASPTPEAAMAQSRPPAGQPTQSPAPTSVRRKKQPPSIFQKKPSRPFAVMEKDKERERELSLKMENERKTAGRVDVRKSATPRGSPTPKPQGDGAGPSTSSTVPNGKAGTPPIKTTGSPAATPPGSQPTPAEPQLKYQEFRLVSCDRQGWDYEMMRFESRKPVDIMTFRQPVKLNRKELKREVAPTNTTQVPVKPMLGADGKPVVGSDGKIVMVDAEGKPITGDGTQAPPPTAGTTKKDNQSQKKKFQKKTKQVFLAPEHIRQLRKEERYPWVLEDATGEEIWEGRMEETAKTELYGFFIPSTEDAFKFIPAHRSYKFQKRRAMQLWSLEDAEKMMTKMQKSRDSERWAVRQRNGGNSLVYESAGASLGAGGRQLRTVDNGPRRAVDEDDEEGMAERRNKEKEREQEGDMDEMEFEEEFADDEEKQDLFADDEETKELEERLKREYRNANKTQEGHIDEDVEEDEDDLTRAGKAIKKLMRKNDQDGIYDSDEEKNPYASSEEEEEEEPVEYQTGPAVQDQKPRIKETPGTPSIKVSTGSKTPSRPGSRGGSPAPNSGGSVKVKNEATPISLAPPATPGSPSPTSPTGSGGGGGIGMGGHSVVAKRATSPKAPKLKTSTSGNSRAASPLAGSRAGSPVPASPTGTGTTTPSKKRKAEEGSGAVIPNPSASSGTPKPKKHKPVLAQGGTPGPGAASTSSAPGTSTAAPATPTTASGGAQVGPGTELTAALLAAFLRGRTGVRTRECIHYFQPCLTDDAKKARFTALVKEVASLKGGALVLKPQYRDGMPA